MATRICQADGNLTAAGTWLTVDATSLLNSEANATALGIAYVESSAFTPGAITIDGIAVKIADRIASPTGTMSIRLAQAGVLVAGTEVTINITDIDIAEAWASSSQPSGMGWYFFKFAAPVLLVAATPYTVSAKCSVAGEVTLNRNATANNWCRMLRTTTGGAAPAAGDNLFILGEWTAAATKTNRTVTMDSTAATDYGDGTASNPPGFGISKGGTLTWGSTGGVNYILQLSTSLAVYAGGTMTMGTVATPIPRNSTATLQFDCGADGDFGLLAHGTVTIQGLSRTVGKIVDRCKLNGDEAAAQTVLSVDTDTGWLNPDDVVIASTTRTVSQIEARVISSVAATTITVTAGLTNAHSGTAPTQAEIILLTRNVVVKSVSSTFMAFMYCGTVGTVDADWADFRYLGANATRKRGVEISTTTGSATFTYCAFREYDYGGVFIQGASANNFALSFCVGYKVGGLTAGVGGVTVNSALTNTAWSITDFWILCSNNSAGACFHFASLNGTIQRIVAACGPVGIETDLDEATNLVKGTCSDWTAHTCGVGGILFQNQYGGTVSNLTAWRCNGAAGQYGVILGGRCGFITLDTISAFGNATANMGCTAACIFTGPNLIRAAVTSGDSTFATGFGWQYGAAASSNMAEPVIFENCTFGVAAGIFVAHTGADIDFNNTAPCLKRAVCRNTLLASATEVNNLQAVLMPGGVFHEKKDQVAATHRTVYGTYGSSGTIDYETGTFHTASPSEKLTPVGATTTMRLRSQVRRIPVASGQSLAVSVWVQKSAAYAGSAPRLIQRSNAAIGLNSDVVLDTAAAAVSVWEQLTGTVAAVTDDGVIELYVDCDGNAGALYVDEWAAAVA